MDFFCSKGIFDGLMCGDLIFERPLFPGLKINLRFIELLDRVKNFNPALTLFCLGSII